MKIKENIIKNKAYYLILDYGSTNFLNKQDLIKICEQNNWILQTYEQGESYIISEGLERFTIRKSFWYFDKKNLTYIFYDDSLTELEQMLSISHEIGHILLNHSSIILIGEIGINNWQEIESEIFAYELLLPSIILRKLRLKKVELEKLFSLTPEWYSYIFKQLSEKNNIDLKLEYDLTQLFHSYILKSKRLLFFEKFNKKNLKFIIISVFIFIFLVCSIIYTISQQTFLASNKQIYKSEPLDQKKNTTLEVVKTPTGERYHLPNCQYIKGKEVLTMSIEKAKGMGYAPCRTCKPDELIP